MKQQEEKKGKFKNFKKMQKKRKYYSSRKKTSIFKKKWFWKLILVLVFLGGCYYLILKTPYFQIQKVEFLAEDNNITKEIQDKVYHQNFFLLNSAELSKNVEMKFPQVKQVLIQKKFPNKILIQIVERKEFGVFCFQSESENCFSLSEEGIIFKPIQQVNEVNEKILIIALDVKNPKLGDKVIEEDLMKDIKFLKDELQKLQIPLTKVEISPLELKATTRQNFLIYFSRENSFKIQINALTELFKNTISKEEQGNLEYIDLRGVKSVDQRGVIYVK